VVERTLNRAGVQIRYVRQELDDSPAGQLQKDVMAAVDSFERGNLAVRFKLGKRAKISRGRVMGQGRVPYGFVRVTNPRTGKTVGLEIDEPQAAVVRRIVAEMREYSVDQIATRLNAERIPTPTGKYAWSGASVYKIVTSPAIWGEYVHGRVTESREFGRRKTVRRAPEDWVPVVVPAIVHRAEIEEAGAAMAQRKATHRPRRQNALDDPFSLRRLL
jgi:site-specific DNA recombinase